MAIDHDTLYTCDPDSTFKERVTKLSNREHQVIRLAMDGLTNKDIGTKLDISYRTVEVHRRHACAKLGAENSSHMARIYIEGVTGVPLP